MRLVGGVSVLLLQLADEAILLAPDFLKLVVGKITPLFPRTPFEFLPLALDDVPVHGLGTPSRIRLRLQDRAERSIYLPRGTAKHGQPIRHRTPRSPSPAYQPPWSRVFSEGFGGTIEGEGICASS